MKKKLIALAVAGAMAAPMAALADVTISGQLQTQIVNVSSDFASEETGITEGLFMTDGGSVENTNKGGSWGALNLSASEDLGGGLKAIARYSFNITTDAGIDTRDAYVGLAGDFGSVMAGRMNHVYKTSTIGWDPFVGTFMQSRFNGGMGGTESTLLYGTERSNTIAYRGNFGGVRVGASIEMDESLDVNNKTNGDHGFALSVNAPVGPIELALAYLDTGSDLDETAIKVGAKFAAGDLTVAGQVEILDDGFTGTGDGGNVYFLTAGYQMGANNISLSFGMTEDDAADGEDVTHIALGFSHAFSQKTNVFAGVGNTDVDGDTHTVVGAGLRVRF